MYNQLHFILAPVDKMRVLFWSGKHHFFSDSSLLNVPAPVSVLTIIKQILQKNSMDHECNAMWLGRSNGVVVVSVIVVCMSERVNISEGLQGKHGKEI